jgi:hypothetical protein
MWPKSAPVTSVAVFLTTPGHSAGQIGEAKQAKKQTDKPTNRHTDDADCTCISLLQPVSQPKQAHARTHTSN